MSTLLKLIKYDLKYILKSVLVFACILLFSVIIFNLTCYDYEYQVFEGYNISTPTASVFIQIVHTVAYNAIYTCLLAMVFNCIARIWHRYRANFFHDEAYLTHTLPIERSTLWLAKFLSTIAALACTFIVAALASAVLNLTDDGKNFLISSGLVPGAETSYYIAYVLTLFVEVLFITLCGMTGLTTGHQFNNHRSLKTVLSGFAYYTFGGLTLLAVIFIYGQFNPDFYALLFGDTTGLAGATLFTQDFITQLLYCIVGTYAVLNLALYGVNYALLRRGINLD